VTALLRQLVVSPRQNLDLLLAWLLTVVLHPLVPLGHPLGRDDLAPWTTACMVVVAVLRGRTLGDDRPGVLVARQVWWARVVGRASLALAPVSLLLWYDAAATRSWTMSYAAAGLSALTVVLAWTGRSHGDTAWSPERGRKWLRWTLRAAATVILALVLGAASSLLGTLSTLLGTLPAAGLLGLQFHSVGLLPDRIRTLWQRHASGRRDGRPYRAPRFRYVLALLGPSIGMMVLLMLHALVIGPVSFAQGPALALHVFAWAAVVWPHRIPTAVSCVLHEIVPAAGKDPAADGIATAFDRPPVGALRLDPLGVKRLRVLHHWVVPVRDPRIEELDDPIRPLWPRLPRPVAHHVLGDAGFEPDPVTHIPQWRTITVRLEDQRDIVRLEQGNVQTRRLVVLRPFPSRGRGGVDAMPTYRWDPRLPPGTLQVVDATTDRLTLCDGDIVVLSTEGVARAFELEIGAPIDDWAAIGGQRAPQLEDYVGLA
jgi:hypothetical protein